MIVMVFNHWCNILAMWAADPRSPIEVEKEGKCTLRISSQKVVTIDFCPFCGDRLDDMKARSEAEGSCNHLQRLAGELGSTVIYRSERKEFWLAGLGGLGIRLFYCPLCGRRLQLHKKGLVYKKSPEETDRLKKRFRCVSTIDDAIKLIGKPDVDYGPTEGCMYPYGKPARVGYKRSLIYEHLAETVRVEVTELLDGRIAIRFHAKEDG